VVEDDDVHPPAIIISAVDLRRTFGVGGAAVEALSDVSVDFPIGGFSAIMGPSGSGKSSLVHVLAGLDLPRRLGRDRRDRPFHP